MSMLQSKSVFDRFIFSVSLVVIDKAGRRVLLVVSGIVMFLSLSVIGAYFYVIYEIDSSMEQELSWLPLGDSYLKLYAPRRYIAFGLTDILHSNLCVHSQICERYTLSRLEKYRHSHGKD